MIRAKVTQEFKGVEDGKVYPRMIEVGEEISGLLAEAAIGEKWAKETKDSRAERAAADEETDLQVLQEKADADAAAALTLKREEDVAKLALLTHEQLVAVATEHQIDISGDASEAGVIDAVQRGLAALKIEVPAPTASTAP